MAKVKREEIDSPAARREESPDQRKETDTGKDSFIKNLIHRDYEENLIRKPFENAQFHQCMPNPYLEGEFITVQLVKAQLKEAEVDDFDPDNFQNFNLGDYEHNSAQLFQNYEFDTNKQQKMKSRLGDYFIDKLSAKSENVIQKAQYI